MAEDLEEDFEEGEAVDEADRPHGGGGSGKLKKILILVLPLLLMLGAAAGAYFSGVLDPVFAMFGGSGDKQAEDAPPPPPSDPLAAAVFFDLPEMLVNLNTTGRKQSFLKIRVSLELGAAADSKRIEQVMPRIVDAFQVYLRELRLEDLQGAAGMYRLREELLLRVNTAARPARVNDVLFKEMLVQ
jgi:flagellar FliL protein